MNRPMIRFILAFGLLGVFLLTAGGFCHPHNPFYYNPPTFDLHVFNNDSVEVDVYIDDAYQDFADPYSELILVEVPESINTKLYAEAQDLSGDWGPDIVDTRYLWTYDWILDAQEWFTLTVINNDIWVGCDVYVDSQYVGSVPANAQVSFDNLATNLLTEIEITALDLSWTVGPDLYDTTDTGTGYAGELQVTVP